MISVINMTIEVVEKDENAADEEEVSDDDDHDEYDNHDDKDDMIMRWMMKKMMMMIMMIAIMKMMHQYTVQYEPCTVVPLDVILPIPSFSYTLIIHHHIISYI